MHSIIWSPWQSGLINAIESVQRYFTRRLIWPKVLPYNERLAVLELETLQLRRLKFDMYYCYKILNNLTCINKDLYFVNDNRDLNIRNYDKYRLRYNSSSSCCCSNHFFNRCVDIWNSLPLKARTASSLNVFKLLLNSHDFTRHLKGRA
jgi:hypothetical protein